MGRWSDSRVRSILQDRTRIVVLILISLLAGCVSSGGYIRGHVVDADTREPIQDAHVAITWDGDELAAVVDTMTVCIRADGPSRIPTGISGSGHGCNGTGFYRRSTCTTPTSSSTRRVISICTTMTFYRKRQSDDELVNPIC